MAIVGSGGASRPRPHSSLSPQARRREVAAPTSPRSGALERRMTRLMKIVVVAGLLWPGGEACAQTLDAVRSSQRLTCGTVQNADDWNGEDEHGDLSALGGEICRAVAVRSSGEATVDGATLPLRAGRGRRGEVRRSPTRHRRTPSSETAVRYGVTFGPPVSSTPSGSWRRGSRASLSFPISGTG